MFDREFTSVAYQGLLNNDKPTFKSKYAMDEKA